MAVFDRTLLSKSMLIALCLLVFSFYPFITVLLLSALLSIYSARENDAKWVYGIFVTCFLLVVGAYISLKTGAPDDGNDKLQYLLYVDSFRNNGFVELLLNHPEVVSFGLLYLLSFVSNDNLVFLIYFLLAFSVLYKSFERFLYLFPLFMLIFASTTFFLNLYGNLIRQSLAFSFLLFFVIAAQGRFKYCSYVLAVFSHFSTLVFFPIVFAMKREGILSLKFSLALLCSAFLLSPLITQVFIAFADSSIDIVSNKSDIYTEWDYSSSVSPIRVFLLTVIILVFSRYIPNAYSMKRNVELSMLYVRLYNVLIVMAAVLFLFLSLDKVFERLFFNYYIIWMVFVVCCMFVFLKINMRVICFCLLSFVLMFLVGLRFVNADWFYENNASAILFDNIFEVYFGVFQ
jgi:hypothetical protein